MNKIFLLFFLWPSLSLLAFPQNTKKPNRKVKTKKIYLGGKHIILLNSDGTNIYATYYFGIFNQFKKRQELKVDLWLPKKTIEFEPQSGLTKEEIFLAENGSLYVKKKFKPGLSLIGINFKVPYKKRMPLEFKLPYNLKELNFATPHNSQVQIHADGFKKGLSAMLTQGSYRGILKRDLKQGEHFTLTLKGLPLPDYYSWYFFITTGIFLCFCLAFFLFKSYPFKETELTIDSGEKL